MEQCAQGGAKLPRMQVIRKLAIDTAYRRAGGVSGYTRSVCHFGRMWLDSESEYSEVGG